MDLIYLYCVIHKAPELKSFNKSLGFYSEQPVMSEVESSRGINDMEKLIDGPYFIYHQGLFVLVSRVRKDEFGEENLKKNLADLEWIEQRASIHEKVIEEVMKDTCVIPFKFATLFNNEDSLKAMVEEYAEELKNNLNNLEGKEEWGLKIYCDIEKLKGVLTQKDDEISKVDKEISSSSPGKAFILKKKKKELLNTVLNAKLNKYGQNSFEELKELSLQTSINKLLPKEITERKDEMILNAAFLMAKDKVKEFISRVDNLKTEYSDKGIDFDCTGPWPPYNFTIMEKA